VTGTAIGVLGFVALLASGLGLEIAGRRCGGAVTAGQALAAAMRTTFGRVAVLAAWIWIGVHFLAR